MPRSDFVYHLPSKGCQGSIYAPAGTSIKYLQSDCAWKNGIDAQPCCCYSQTSCLQEAVHAGLFLPTEFGVTARSYLIKLFSCQNGCVAGKYPGDDSPVVWGVCGHAFHLQCITKWLSSQTEQRCPFCRRNWEYKSAGPVQMEAEEAA